MAPCYMLGLQVRTMMSRFVLSILNALDNCVLTTALYHGSIRDFHIVMKKYKSLKLGHIPDRIQCDRERSGQCDMTRK